MHYFNINNPAEKVSLKDAVLKSISNNSGLYMPQNIPALPASYFENIYTKSLQEIAFDVAYNMFSSDIEKNDLQQLAEQAVNFPIPLKHLADNLLVLELFHGPTLAFKDVGARFMAGLFEYFLRNENKEVTILVATSGDTGGAVAHAFYNKKGIKVCILYPSGKVSALQEKQLTTMGGNITALEVAGNFDDCQRLVKQAFSDSELNEKMNLTSANSINFVRLFPQSFYYFYAFAQVGKTNLPITFSVPSGNFGNLTAGLIAYKMGLPVAHFYAATNSNHAVPDYLKTGTLPMLPIQYTLSNAMDVAVPSNFPRMLSLFNEDYNSIAHLIKGHWCNDEETIEAMKYLQTHYQYQADPHGAIAFDALQKNEVCKHGIGIFLETAHPAKFPEAVNAVSPNEIQIPDALKDIMTLPKKAIKIDNSYEALLGQLQ